MVKARVSTAGLVAGRYRLVDVVHRETNRVSYYGEDTETGHPCLLTQIGLPDEPCPDERRRATSRILRTSERMGLLRPGAVATVVDAIEESGSLWIVSGWIDGTPLGELLTQQGTFNYVRAARIGLELLDVLEAAHVAGITHGELSPGQVFVRDEGSVVVTGFGLAGATLAPRVAAPSYASPEQARDERIGPASDLWALGAILYTMVEGRPPYRERDRPEATLKGVDRLPLRAPVRSGPLTQAVQGLLRKDSRERLSRPVVRDAFVRVLNEEPEAPLQVVPRLRGRYVMGPRWSRRAMVVGTALAVVTVAAAVLVVTNQRPDDSESSAAGAAPSPSASAGAPTDPSPTPPPSASPTEEATEPGTPSASPSGTADLPPGYTTYESPDGFSVALPEGWTAVRTTRAADVAYRVTFSADDDPRKLAVTYSERLRPDPVAVWRDDVQPGLEEQGGFERIGDIEATTYRGFKAADMQWLSEKDGTRVRTFGRGFLIEDHRGYSLRWTTPEADWDDPGNREALDVILRTFTVPED
ncbi:serine/threonine protein kinase [Streptomyces viridochromogenes]|uniref:non-specific serine/threonine protein kinase n=1 Tax=Streptomyces viridochromogenes TaxID=1938 RepID=A0A0J7ZF68_STRVR|nr:serine/threonine-protein kinase [Streptomyces viridochromogenes]KMS74002.1 serine/threonine protein kinase [Streptomyces viridochromogenes]KOG11122.1 serine/threonine protein kinase [Streptomyces viridochromogenes]KOG26123.1 serine/threonine protein kinase [Streptomyces viridochromogenes]